MALSDITTMTLSAGVSCLDYVNTGLEVDSVSVERLHSYMDILTLAERLSILKAADLRKFESLAKADPLFAQRSLEKGIKLRQVLNKIFTAVVDHSIHEINHQDILKLNAWRIEALGGQILVSQGKTLTLDWAQTRVNLMQPFWIFTLSAVDLLQNQSLKYVKRCAGCDWFFYDQSKSHRRKWCDMQSCGSSAKGARYYQRKKLNLQL
ncbi:MAG: CGNR zinc finger domain-containing protein [Sphingobacterium sp.]